MVLKMCKIDGVKKKGKQKVRTFRGRGCHTFMSRYAKKKTPAKNVTFGTGLTW